MIAPQVRLFACAAALFVNTVMAADLRIGMAADITSMDPHAVNISPNNNIGWHVFDALVHVDADARIAPGLAQSWRAVDDTTWEFRLRRNVKFHDGSPFTAEDVLFSIERAEKLPNGQYASFVQRLTERRALDPYTVRVKTATPYAMVPYDLNSIFIVSKKAGAAASADFDSRAATVLNWQRTPITGAARRPGTKSRFASSPTIPRASRPC